MAPETEDEQIEEGDNMADIDTSSFSKTRKDLLIAIAIVVVIAIIALIVGKFFGNKVTGYVVADIDKLKLDEMAYNNSNFIITGNSTIPLSSLKISGKVIGNGTANVYLNHGEQKSLVFSNNPENVKIPAVTGMAVLSSDNGVNLYFDNLRFADGILSGISVESKGNPEGTYFEKIKLSWSPNNGENIVGIRLDGQDFWGYGQAGESSPEPQPSGTTLIGWGQPISEGTMKEFNEFKFDSSMENKQLTLEIYYNDYLPGRRLGDEKLIKLYLDLSGEKNSYVEQDGEQQQTFKLKKSETTSPPGEKPIDDQPIPDDQKETPDGTPQEGQAETGGTQTTNPGTETEPGTGQQTGKTTDASLSDFKLTNLPDGKIQKQKSLAKSNIQFNKNPDISVNFEVIVDPSYKAIFDNTVKDPSSVEEIRNQCLETCILNPKDSSGSYTLSFDVDPGTAINITDVSFS